MKLSSFCEFRLNSNECPFALLFASCKVLSEISDSHDLRQEVAIIRREVREIEQAQRNKGMYIKNPHSEEILP